MCKVPLRCSISVIYYYVTNYLQTHGLKLCKYLLPLMVFVGLEFGDGLDGQLWLKGSYKL